jgi:hypothetical protein
VSGDEQESCVTRRAWRKCARRDTPARLEPEHLPGSGSAHTPTGCPSPGRPGRHDNAGAVQVAAGRGETPQQCGRDSEGRVGRNLEGPTRQAEIGRVGLYDDDPLAAELSTQVGGASRMQFNRNDGCSAGK